MKVQRRLAAGILKCSPYRIKFDAEKLSDVNEAITREDVKELISKRIITKKPTRSTSRARAIKLHLQKTKGRRKGHGSRKGKKTARSNPKIVWIRKVRLQRAFLKDLRDKGALNTKTYRVLYMKSKGGFFRSKHHIEVYIKEKISR